MEAFLKFGGTHTVGTLDGWRGVREEVDAVVGELVVDARGRVKRGAMAI